MKSRKFSGRGRSPLKVRVRTAKKRKQSSTRWLARHLNDPYVQLAKSEGYRGRAAYKLIELDDRFKFLVAGARVIDLGCAPGSWSQVAAARTNAVGSRNALSRGRVIGVDLREVEPIAGAEFLQLDFLAEDSVERLRDAAGGAVDVILSDMAAPSTGHAKTDHLRIVHLCQCAADFAFEMLSPGGTFVSKVLEGGAEGSLQKLVKKRFEKVVNVKPAASRRESSEKYLVALGHRGSE